MQLEGFGVFNDRAHARTRLVFRVSRVDEAAKTAARLFERGHPFDCEPRPYDEVRFLVFCDSVEAANETADAIRAL